MYNEISKKKTGFNLYESRHCAHITYSVKTCFLKNLSVCPVCTVYGRVTLCAFEAYTSGKPESKGVLNYF